MTVYIVDLEPIETRYTKQWKKHLPEQLEKELAVDVVTISGNESDTYTTRPGAFLDFSKTNEYKSQQLEKISVLFSQEKIKPGDYFLYTDAWNPTVIQLRYMAELLEIPIYIGGMWHAGSYDEYDFLGRLIGDKQWVRRSEYAMFNCYDQNFFATKHHINLFEDGVLDYNAHLYTSGSIIQTGWPMEYLIAELMPYKGRQKEDIILFPHRIAPEKQHDIFKDLEKSLPEYKFITCQEQQLTKHQYHDLLSRAKLVFSANQQETLGISWYEGLLLNAVPMVPDRLSYSEMAFNEFKYPSHWTVDFDHYLKNKDSVIARIHEYMRHPQKYISRIPEQSAFLETRYFSGSGLYNAINNVIQSY